MIKVGDRVMSKDIIPVTIHKKISGIVTKIERCVLKNDDDSEDVITYIYFTSEEGHLKAFPIDTLETCPKD